MRGVGGVGLSEARKGFERIMRAGGETCEKWLTSFCALKRTGYRVRAARAYGVRMASSLHTRRFVSSASRWEASVTALGVGGEGGVKG